jgi:F-type H+-transporting ATPase subunit a
MNKNYISYQNKFVITLFLAVFTFFSNSIYASHNTEENNPHQVLDTNDTEHSDDKVDITKVAFEHILDSHSWHLWGEGHDAVAIPLPVILYSSTKGLQLFSSAHFEHGHATYNGYKLQEEQILSDDSNEIIYDLSITKNVASMLISVLIIVLIFTSIAKAYKKTGITSAPKGKQSFFEPLIIFVRDDIAKNNIGTKSTKFVPYLLTLFFFILINNLLGMLPFGANLTGNIAFTLVLSVITLIVTNVNGNAQYWHHLFMPPAPKWLYPILIPIELVGILTKPFALMIRLFANITAGHIIIISLVGLIFIFKSLAVSPISVAFALFIDVLECLVAFLQAYIFTMLTALFIGSAVADHHHEEEHSNHHDGDDQKNLAKSH